MIPNEKPQKNKSPGLNVLVKGGSQFTSFSKSKNPNVEVRALYSRRDLNPHGLMPTGF